MKKIYGFKTQDVIGLINYINDSRGENLSQIFNKYARISKKSKGTIRNLYYSIAKLSASDEEFSKTYLNGKVIEVEKKEDFSSIEERKLIEDILTLKGEGKSVRKAVSILAKGDERLALRYQNKFRATLKNKPKMVNEIINALLKKNPNLRLSIESKENKFLEKRVKLEIDKLFDRVFLELKKENSFLKGKVIELESRIFKNQETLEAKRENNIRDYFHK
jgi:hypothetical protein